MKDWKETGDASPGSAPKESRKQQYRSIDEVGIRSPDEGRVGKSKLGHFTVPDNDTRPPEYYRRYISGALDKKETPELKGWTSHETRALIDAISDAYQAEQDNHAVRIRFNESLERLRTDPTERNRIADIVADFEATKQDLSMVGRPSIAAGQSELIDLDVDSKLPSITAGKSELLDVGTGDDLPSITADTEMSLPVNDTNKGKRGPSVG